MRCFVPNCENTTGVPFPEDQDLKNIWLKSLNLVDVLPVEESFVCLNHFDDNDIEDFVNEENLHERRVLPNAVPKLFSPDVAEVNVVCQSTNENLESPQNDSESSNFYIPINEESSTQSGDVTESQQNHSNQDLEISPQSSDLNPENEGLITEHGNNAEQSEISNSDEVQEGTKTEEKVEGLLEQILPEAVQSPHNDEDVEKEPELADFQKFEGLLQDDYLKSKLDKDENVEEDKNQDEGVEYLAVDSQLQHEDGASQGTNTKEEAFTSDEGPVPVQIFATEDQPDLTSENQHLFIAEGQNIITTAGQHVFVSEGQTLLTTEGQQVYVTEGGQTVFTANGQQVFVSGGQALITEDGQRVFLGGDEESFNQENNFITSNNDFQNTEESQSMADQGAIVQIGEDPRHADEHTLSEELKLGAVKLQVMDENVDQPKGNFMNARQLVINEQMMPAEYMDQNESMEEQQNEMDAAASAVLVKQEKHSPDHVMEWFVTPPTQTSQPITNFSGILTQSGTKPHGAVTSNNRMQSGVLQRGTQQIALKRSHDSISGPSTSKTSDESNSEETCRLCGHVAEKYVNILDNIKSNIMILEAIQLCIHPLEVSLEDPFSKKICVSCFNSLQKYYEFRQKCLEMNISQRRQYERAHPGQLLTPDNRVRKTHMKTIITPTKGGYQQTEVLTFSQKGYGAKNITRKVILTPTNYKTVKKEPLGQVRKMFSRTNKSDNIQVFKTESKPKIPAIPILSPKNISASQIEALARKPPLSPEKQLKIQEELKKVIEGKMSKDDLSVDQIIVRVVSDDENDDGASYVPVKRKRIGGMNTTMTRTGHSKMKIGKNEVVIPKGIRVTIPDRFENSRGVFPCIKKVGAFNTEFSLIDGYLFEYRLCKGKERFLKCLTDKCPSKAKQKMLVNDTFESRANVFIAHNHHPQTTSEIKKQMFYYIMKKKMQADRGLNFRNIYDQICQKDPEIAILVPLRSLINEICKHQLAQKVPPVNSFADFYNMIEDDSLQKFQFTFSGQQFYQERFTVAEEGSMAIVFANVETIKKVSDSKLMYVDASFRIDTCEKFSYQLVTVLVWIDDSYYPIMFALVSDRTMEIFKKIFGYLHDTLAPNLCPDEIVTDYEANIYYALGETYLNSHIGGSVFYYTQNLYKKICELGLSKDLETTSYFRNIYHMLLMLPLLPVNTIMDGLQNIEIQANDLGIGPTTSGLFAHIREQWIEKVTPDLFCVHRLENRINENVIAPFKKLRDFLMLNKGKAQRQSLTLPCVVEKLIELENFLQTTYSSENKKSFGRDLSSSQKKNVLKAWHYIESHPKININHFFTKVIGYIKCMENQLWIWGYYKFSGKVTDDLINAANFSIVNNEGEIITADDQQTAGTAVESNDTNDTYSEGSDKNALVMEAMVGPCGEFVLTNMETNYSTMFSKVKPDPNLL